MKYVWHQIAGPWDLGHQAQSTTSSTSKFLEHQARFIFVTFDIFDKVATGCRKIVGFTTGGMGGAQWAIGSGILSIVDPSPGTVKRKTKLQMTNNTFFKVNNGP